MLIAADSPIVDNPAHCRLPKNVKFAMPSLPAQLDKAGWTRRNYNGDAFDFIKGLQGKKLPSVQLPSPTSGGRVRGA